MKRKTLVRLFSLTLVLVMTTIGGVASASLTHQTVITFNIEPTIEVTSWPSNNLTLAQGAVPGQPVVFEPLSMTVRSNAPWSVSVRTDSEAGTLRIWDHVLESYAIDEPEVGPLEIRHSGSGSWTVLSEDSEDIYTDNNPTGQAGKTIDFQLRVTPSFDDKHLDDGRIYRVILYYTAGVGF